MHVPPVKTLRDRIVRPQPPHDVGRVIARLVAFGRRQQIQSLRGMGNCPARNALGRLHRRALDRQRGNMVTGLKMWFPFARNRAPFPMSRLPSGGVIRRVSWDCLICSAREWHTRLLPKSRRSEHLAREGLGDSVRCGNEKDSASPPFVENAHQRESGDSNTRI